VDSCLTFAIFGAHQHCVTDDELSTVAVGKPVFSFLAGKQRNTKDDK
jgi:hypothetical protein